MPSKADMRSVKANQSALPCSVICHYATHTEVTAVALIPCKLPSLSLHEMMLTVVANRRIASRMTPITTGISLNAPAVSNRPFG